MSSVENFTLLPYVDDIENPFYAQHREQQTYRYCLKPASTQINDAFIQDAFEKGIEYVDDPRETAFIEHAYNLYNFWDESDHPYNMPERITEQLAFFEQLDSEQELWMLQEPRIFSFPTLVRDWENIQHHCIEYARRRTPVPYDPVQYAGDLSDYIQQRMKEVTEAGNRRLERLWQDHETRRPRRLSLKYLIDINQISTDHITV